MTTIRALEPIALGHKIALVDLRRRRRRRPNTANASARRPRPLRAVRGCTCTIVRSRRARARRRAHERVRCARVPGCSGGGARIVRYRPQAAMRSPPISRGSLRSHAKCLRSRFRRRRRPARIESSRSVDGSDGHRGADRARGCVIRSTPTRRQPTSPRRCAPARCRRARSWRRRLRASHARQSGGSMRSRRSPQRVRSNERSASTRQRRAGTPLGELAGVPFGVKAMIDVAGLTTTGGSALYRNAAAATRDAVVVRKLEAAGAVCVGAHNMDEFGMGGTTENACFGPTRNPHDLARTPGGSSGGSAAAVAAGMVPIAIGSDGLGSIRLPASLCGVFGLRPTRGADQRWGRARRRRYDSHAGTARAQQSRHCALPSRSVRGTQGSPVGASRVRRADPAGDRGRLFSRSARRRRSRSAAARHRRARHHARDRVPAGTPCARCGDARQCRGECRRQARRAAHAAGQVRSCDARPFSRACAAAGAVVSRRRSGSGAGTSSKCSGSSTKST